VVSSEMVHCEIGDWRNRGKGNGYRGYKEII
jgi:hypothetical protein